MKKDKTKVLTTWSWKVWIAKHYECFLSDRTHVAPINALFQRDHLSSLPPCMCVANTMISPTLISSLLSGLPHSLPFVGKATNSNARDRLYMMDVDHSWWIYSLFSSWGDSTSYFWPLTLDQLLLFLKKVGGWETGNAPCFCPFFLGHQSKRLVILWTWGRNHEWKAKRITTMPALTSLSHVSTCQ